LKIEIPLIEAFSLVTDPISTQGVAQAGTLAARLCRDHNASSAQTFLNVSIRAELPQPPKIAAVLHVLAAAMQGVVQQESYPTIIHADFFPSNTNILALAWGAQDEMMDWALGEMNATLKEAKNAQCPLHHLRASEDMGQGEDSSRGA
jgi:hypothetical protein